MGILWNGSKPSNILWSTGMNYVERNLGPINTWTIPSTTTDVVSYSGTNTISLNGKGGHYETCYKSFTVSKSGSYTISYDYDLPTINFYGTGSNHMHFGIYITTNQPPGGDMSTWSDYSTGNCNGTDICGPSSQYNTPGTGHISFNYTLTAGTTYYLWIPMMNLADGVQTYLTFTNLNVKSVEQYANIVEPTLLYNQEQVWPVIYHVTTSGVHGTVTASPTQGTNGTTVTLSNTPDSGYIFSSYSLTGATLKNTNQFDINRSDVEVVGNFITPPASAVLYSDTTQYTTQNTTRTYNVAIPDYYPYIAIKFNQQIPHNSGASYLVNNYLKLNSFTIRQYNNGTNTEPCYIASNSGVTNVNATKRTSDSLARYLYKGSRWVEQWNTFKYVIQCSNGATWCYIQGTNGANYTPGASKVTSVTSYQTVRNSGSVNVYLKNFYIAGFTTLAAAKAY